MRLEADHDQQLVLYHRMHFWGRPTGSGTVSWQYKGTGYQVTRPDDGLPATQCPATCGVCGRGFTLTVHSVGETRLRRARWRAWAWAGLAPVTISVISFFSLPVATLPILLPVAGLGAWFSYVVMSFGASDTGILLDGRGQRGSTSAKHMVKLVPSRPASGGRAAQRAST